MYMFLFTILLGVNPFLSCLKFDDNESYMLDQIEKMND